MVKTDTLLISLDMSRGEDVGVLIVGRKGKGQKIDIVNAFQGKEARELYERIVKKGEAYEL